MRASSSAHRDPVPPQERNKPRNIGAFIAPILAISLISCKSTIDPYLYAKTSANKHYDLSKYGGNLRLKTAIRFAIDQKELYHNALSHQAILNAGIGLALIPITAVASYLGLRNTGRGARDAIAALGISGAGIYAAGSYFRSRPRELVYLAGAAAIDCVLATMEPITSESENVPIFRAYLFGGPLDPGNKNSPVSSSLPALISKMEVQILRVEELYSGRQTALTTIARQQVGRARTIWKDALATDAAFRAAPDRIARSVQRIRTEVDKAVATTLPDFAALAATLAKSIPTSAAQITGVDLGTPKITKIVIPDTGIRNAGPRQGKRLADQRRIASSRLQSVLSELENSLVFLDRAISAVAKKPDLEILKGCGVDIAKAGLTFAVTPSPDAVFNVGSADVTQTLILSGGKVPYSWTWEGLQPPAAAKIVVSNVTYAPNATGAVMVTVPKGTSASEYILRFSHGAEGTRRVRIVVANAGKTPTRTTSNNNTNTTEQKIIKSVQKLIMDFGYKYKLDGKEINISITGKFDNITKSALLQAFDIFISNYKNQDDKKIIINSIISMKNSVKTQKINFQVLEKILKNMKEIIEKK